MILPQNLAPLPVGPRKEDAPSTGICDSESFVLSHDVYRVLLGESGGLPVEGLPAEDFDSFAGRGDVVLFRTSPFLSLAERHPVPAPEPKPLELAPVFETIAAYRRPAPPRISLDVERDFGKISRSGDRWWVFGVALAVAAITLSGTFVDFTSREAVKRAQLQRSPGGTATPAEKASASQELPPSENGEKPRALVSAGLETPR